MEERRKKIWKVVISLLVGGIVILFSFIPVGAFMHGLSDGIASYHVDASSESGGMSGYSIDHSASHIIFFIFMAVYLALIIMMSVKVYKFLK